MAVALAVAAVVVFGLAWPAQAALAADDGSATTTADIVLVVPDDGAGGGGGTDGSGSSGYTRAASPLTGDPVTWLPLFAVAVAAVGAIVLARRRMAPAPAQKRPSRRSVNVQRAAASHSPSARAVHTRKRKGAHARKRGMFTLLAVLVLAGGASAAATVNAKAADGDVIRIEMQRASDGTWQGTTTYYVDNDATYYRDLVKITEAAQNGFNLADGSVTITMAPATDPADAIASPDAVKGAATAGGATWRMPGSAVSDDHALALKVTATAKSLNAGNNEVGTATFDMQAPPYEDLAVRLSSSPVVGKPLAADVSDWPTEATNSFAYTWLVSDDGETWTPVPGATAATFTPTAAQAGKRIAVNVTCENPAWFVVSPTDYGTVAKTSPAPAEGQHLVTFEMGEHGDAPDAQIVDDGAYATRPATDPAAAGYTFGGWYADEECNEPFSFETTPITQDTFVYASWVEDATGTYTVVHLLQNIDDDSLYEEAAREVRTGEATGELSALQKVFAGFTVNTAKSPEAAMQDGTPVMKVYYDRNAYTVTFHSDAAVFKQETCVRYGATVAEPSPAPEITGKDFKRWSKTAGGADAYDFSKPVTGDLDLYAVFETKVLTVTFETWGQTPKPGDQQVEYNDKAAEPSSPAVGDGPTGGPTFQGWYADSSLSTQFDFTQPITEDTTIYGSYTPRVLFVLGGNLGTSVAFPITLGADMTIDTSDHTATKAASGTVVKTVKAAGYKITGWYEDAACTGSPVASLTNIQADKDLYPKVEANKYKVKFEKNDTGATNAMADQEFEYDVEQALSTNAFALQGYTFAGWNTEADGSGASYTDGQNVKNLATGEAGDDEITLYAQWQPATDTPYTVRHWLQNTTGSDYTEDTGAVQALTGMTGAATAASAKTYTGFTALSFTQGTIAADGSTVVDVYYDRDTYTVTYDANGHGANPAPETGVRYGATLSSMPSPAATGYTFGGWYTDANCTTAWTMGTDRVTGDITLYAKWEGLPYKITFNANSAPEGSTETMADQSAKVGDSTTLTANAFTRTGWTFAGWNTASDGTGTHYDDEASSSSFSTDGTDVVLYAQWQGNADINYTVEHYKETGFGTRVYNIVSGDTQTLTGTAGTDTAAAAKTGRDYDDYVCCGTTQGGSGTITQEVIKGDGSTVVKIYYKQGACKVTFQAWGQTVSGDNPQRIAHGGTATQPSTPSEGAGNPKFGGWYTDTAYTTKYDFSAAVASDITLYGKFTPSVTVNFMLWDGSTAGDKVGTSSIPLAMTGDPASAELTATDLSGVVVPAGYTLSGTDFYTDSACSTTLTVPKTGITDDSTVIYARVTANTNTAYTVEHYQQSLSDDSSYELADTDNETGTTGTDTAAAAKTYDGFTCEGTTAGGSGAITQQVIAGDGSTVVKIYYKRDTVNYRVEHHQQDLTGSGYSIVSADTETKSAKTGAATEAAAKTYTGFAAKAFSQETVAGNGSTVVKIYYDRETYTVTFDVRGHGTAPTTQTVRYGGTATVPSDPAETGYDFGGWYQEDACTTAFDFTAAITGNKTAFAKWTKQKFTVSFVVNTAMATKPADQEVEYGEKAIEPTGTIAATGHHLIGWFKDAGYTTTFDFATELIKAATSIYGSFAPDTYTVTYDGNSTSNDVSGLPTTQTKVYGTDLTLSSATPTRATASTGASYTVTYNGNGGTPAKASDTATVGTMYTFTGWNTAADGTGGTAYAAGDMYTDNAPATLYAQWSSAGGTEPVTLPDATNSNSAYRFAGWYTAASGGTYVGTAGDEYEPSDNVELYAHYSAYYLKFENYGSAGAQQYTGSGTMPIQPVDTAAGYAVNKCAFTPPDSSMKFVGWNTKEDGTGRWVLDGEVIKNDEGYIKFNNDGKTCCTLYAQWSHLAGLTAADLAADGAYATYSQYIGDVWIPVTTSGDPSSYDTLQGYSPVNATGSNSAVMNVLVCTLVGAGEDGDNMLAFITQNEMFHTQFSSSSADYPFSWRNTASTGLNDSVTWENSRTRSWINSGNIYNMLPQSLKGEGIVKEVEKKSAIGSDLYTSRDKIWVPSASELGLEYNVSDMVAPVNEGPKYSGVSENVLSRLVTSNAGIGSAYCVRSQGYYTRNAAYTNVWLIGNVVSRNSKSGISYIYNVPSVIGFCL